MALIAVLALPIIAAPIALLVGRRAGGGIAIVVALMQALIVLGAAEETFSLGGVTLGVAPVVRLLLPLMLVAGAGATAFADRDAEVFAPTVLLINGAAAGVLLVDNPFLASLLLQIAGVLVVFLLPRRLHGVLPAASSVKTLTLTVVSSTMLVAAYSLNETYQLGGQNAQVVQLVLTFLGIGLALRVAAFPFHLWFPSLAEAAPPAAMTVVSTVVNVAAFGMLLATFESAPWLVADDRNRMLMASGCAMSAVAGAILATFQHDLRRIVACGTIAEVAIIGFGLVTASGISTTAALVAIVSHVLAVVLLWLTVHQIEQRAGTTIIGMVRGLRASLPVTAAGFLVAGLTVAGFPLFAGFPSRWVFWRLSGDTNAWWALALVAASALLLVTYVRAFRELFLGAPDNESLKPESTGVNVAIIGLIVASVILGTVPGPLFQIVNSLVIEFQFLR